MPSRSELLTNPGVGPESGTTAYRRVCGLAKGGMGQVDLCVRQTGTFSRLYAVKRIHAHHRDDASMRAMFLDEARVAGLIRHANVVPVLDVGEDTDGPFLVMDYVEGVSLSELIRHHVRAREQPPIGLAVQIMAQVARGLHAAHELVGSDGESLNLVHRDVSPQNILVGSDGVVRVTDFGIAKAIGQSTHTSTGLLKGKVGYMSPEQLRFEPPDRRSDLFALGVVLYEALTLRRVYKSDDASAVARAILHQPPPDLSDDRADAPPELVELAFELLAKQRDDRPATAREVADRLEQIASEHDGLIDLESYIQQRFATELLAARSRVREDRLTPATPVRVSPVDSTTAVVRHARRGRAWAVAAVAVVAVVGVSLSLRGEAEAVAQEPSKPAPLADSDEGQREVILQLDSKPSGATVRIDGRAVGATPMEISVPRDGPLRMSLEKAGYAASHHELRPSANERIFVALTVQPVRALAAESGVTPVRTNSGSLGRATSSRPAPRKKKRRKRSKGRGESPAVPSESPFRRFD